MKTKPHLKFEQELWNQGYTVCGIDEVGRGSFAGPLVVGAVVLKPVVSQNDSDWLLSLGINDSKLLSNARRELIYKVAQDLILFSYIQYIPVEIINEKGIGFANKLGFEKAAKETTNACNGKNIFFLTDAFKIPEIAQEKQKNIIQGDATSITIALASILAKVERDHLMEKLGVEFPSYGFEKHKGYGTRLHRDQIKTYGPCEHHRTDFIQDYI